MDSLEKFFKNRALQKDVEFHEADWGKLEKQLDKEMPVVFFSWIWLKKYWWVPTMILLLPTVWFAIDRFGKDTPEMAHENADQRMEIADATDQEQGFEPFKSKSDISAEKIYSNENATGSRNDNVEVLPTDIAPSTIVTAERNTFKTTEDRGYVVLENGVRPSVDSRMAELHFLSPLSPYLHIIGMTPPKMSYTIVADVSEELPSSLDKKPSENHGMTINLGIGYGLDFSTVGLGNFTSPGTRWKVMAEVGITPRLLLHTGITKVHNKYTAYGEDYHAPYRYWKNGIVADEAYGTCDMIDVPLNLRYTFMIKNKHQLFISGGASTYFLTKEAYQFDYTQDDPDLPSEWSTDEMSIYPFGIINFSMGYQYNIGRKGAFQIEPFIKIPTSGIGWGEVDLHTMGVYFMYKYRLGK